MMKQEEKYMDRIEVIEEESKNDTILSTGDFQCPDSGWGCIINWNIDKGYMWAEMCDVGIWDTDNSDTFNLEISEDTFEWCNSFGKRTANSASEANKILKNWIGEDYIHYCFEDNEEE